NARYFEKKKKKKKKLWVCAITAASARRRRPRATPQPGRYGNASRSRAAASWACLPEVYAVSQRPSSHE
ncbi:hypothetical protein ABLN64_08995, partial [Mycobacterium tuberculosis]